MLVWVSATAATEEEAWRAAMVQMLGPFRHNPWHDSTETVLRLLVALRREGQPCLTYVAAMAGACAMPRRPPAGSAQWFTPVDRHLEPRATR